MRAYKSYKNYDMAIVESAVRWEIYQFWLRGDIFSERCHPSQLYRLTHRRVIDALRCSGYVKRCVGKGKKRVRVIPKWGASGDIMNQNRIDAAAIPTSDSWEERRYIWNSNSRCSSPDAPIEDRDFADFFRMTSGITERHFEVLRMRSEGYSCAEIGKRFGLSQSRAFQVLAEALKKVLPKMERLKREMQCAR